MRVMGKHREIKKQGDTKRITIEDVVEDKKDLLEDLVGIVSLPEDLDVKMVRAERKQEQQVKNVRYY